MHTETLSAYIRATMRLQDQPTVLTQQRSEAHQQDGDYTILTHTTDYHFANGVHLVAEVEQEWLNGAELAGDVCPPCDITYRIADAAGRDIQPACKSFKNTCQLHFWVQAHHINPA